VLFNIVAVLSLRWLSTSAAAGPSALTLWVLAALLFFIPQGLAVSELASRYPDEGGIYAWAKRAFGDSHGFLCGWCYWVNNLLYYPNLLISTAVIATFVVGRGNSGLINNWSYVLPATLLMLWFATIMNIVGMSAGKWLQNVGAIATYLPGAFLVLLAAYAVFTRGWANPITPASLVPDLEDLSAINLWASIAFAFAGLELCAVLAGEAKDPARSLPRSIFLSAPFIMILYVVGTASVLALVPSKDVNVVSGFLQAIAVGAGAMGPIIAWTVPFVALLYVIGNLGGIGAWLSGPARVAFMIGIDRYFPPAFGRVHPKWRTPYVAILVQSGFATLFLILSVLGKGTTVERAYLIILDTMLLVYFIPYIYLFIAYLVFTRRQPSPTARGIKPWLVGLAGLGLTLLAMVVAAVPPSDTPSVLLFELKVVGGALGFVVLGLVLYWRGKRQGSET
jgi:amino acid transporter